MGLFDFLKKKGAQPGSGPLQPQQASAQPQPVSPPGALYPFISRYNPYIVRFVGMQQQGNYAPISAYETKKGELIGHLYLGDEHYMLSVHEVVDRMKRGFDARLANGEIRSYAILYHSQFAGDDNHALANSDDELKAISVVYRFLDGPEGAIALPYRFEDDSVLYAGFAGLTREENDLVFGTKLEQGRDYFQERINPQPEPVTNAAGLEITLTNTKNNDNSWGGVFGFDALHSGRVHQMRAECAALAMTGEAKTNNGMSVYALDAEDLQLKVVSMQGKPRAILPVVKTGRAIDVRNLAITEWENNGEIAEALIKASGRDTFGIYYYATDYAENKALYLSAAKLDVCISGIAFVLDLHKKEKEDGELKFSDEFTAYMPSGSVPDYGCFDFIGKVEQLRETTAMEGLAKGYIMTTRLITHDDPGFFTIDVFVSRENMRFEHLEKGMKVTGMLQLQGQIGNRASNA